MNETSKTVAFVITAVIIGASAGATHLMTQPKPVTGFEKVGQEFFPEFDDASKAQSLEVTVYDDDSDRTKSFEVAFKDGRWRIPSHHDYPAEAAERLARTATSVIGLNRESCVARRARKHEEFGVLDPSDEEANVDSAGQRITLKDEEGNILADYLIGKPAGSVADDSNSMVREIIQQNDFFYVRVPGEKETYRARVEIDLSTKFADWIEPDLLKLEASELTRIEIDNYELAEQQVPVGNGQVQVQVAKNVIDRQRLTREGVEPWELDGLNSVTEEVNTVQVNEIVNLLDSMTIAGVRPKVKLNGQLLVTSDLTVNEELAKQDPQLFQRRLLELQRDLEVKGFTIGAQEEDRTKITLLGSRGELRASTNLGVSYSLYFGRTVSGDQSEIEIGAAKSSTDSDNDTKEDETPENEAEAESAESEEAESESESEEATGNNRSRYVAIRIDFDESALGEKPVKPVEPSAPEKPEGYDEWKAKKQKMLEERAAAAEAEGLDPPVSPENANEDNPAPEAPQDISVANEKEFEEYEAAESAYQTAQVQFQTDTEMFEANEIAFNNRMEQGKKIVTELNERFAEWYYVVPAESLAILKLTRADLVKIKQTEPPALEPPAGFGGSGDGLGINTLPQSPNISFSSDDEDDSPNEDEPLEETQPDGNEEGEEDDAEEEEEEEEAGNKNDTGDGKKKEDG